MSISTSSSTKEASGRPTNEFADAEQNFKPKTFRFWIILLCVYSSLFLVALDRMIIATAIPAITNEFHSISDIGWYGSAYMLTCAASNPTYGRLFQLYPTKLVYLISIIIFEIGSAVCGAAPNSVAFIVGRAIAGMGAAGIFTGGIMITIPLIPLRKRPVFQSFFGIIFGVSSIIGPLVGGGFTDNASLTWRWCFYINLPIGAAVVIALVLFLHIDDKPWETLPLLEQLKRLDPLGLLFFVPSMVCLILALQWGGTTYSWSTPKMIGLLVTFAVTLVIFIFIQVFMPKTAMVPMRIVLDRSIAGAMLFTFLSAGGMMIGAYYLVIWFQAAQSQSALDSGIRLLPMVLSLVLFGFLAAAVTQKIGYYVPAMLLSPIFAAVGMGMLSTLSRSSGASAWIGYQIIYGIGLGIGSQSANLVSQATLPRADIPIGMAMQFFMQQIGGAVFLSVAQNLFSSSLVTTLSGVAGLDARVIINTGATDLRTTVPKNQIDMVIDAYSHSITQTFLVGAGLSACMMIGALSVKWRNIKGKRDAEDEDKKGQRESSENV